MEAFANLDRGDAFAVFICLLHAETSAWIAPAVYCQPINSKETKGKGPRSGIVTAPETRSTSVIAPDRLTD